MNGPSFDSTKASRLPLQRGQRNSGCSSCLTAKESNTSEINSELVAVYSDGVMSGKQWKAGMELV